MEAAIEIHLVHAAWRYVKFLPMLVEHPRCAEFMLQLRQTITDHLQATTLRRRFGRKGSYHEVSARLQRMLLLRNLSLARFNVTEEAVAGE